MNTLANTRSIGKYEIVDRIGAGGMGEVFRARLSGEGGFIKYIAIKSLLPQRAYDQEYLRRFLREAKIVARLNHPNIVQVFEVWPEEGTYYIAMDLVDGHDFGNLLLRCASLREPVPQLWIAHTLAEALLGLDHAHTKADESGQPLGIVHRDMSPENILISYDGSVKITDFGVAKGFAQPTGAWVVGKPRYMAPEQARGGAIDGRADVYSVGIILWEAMTMTAAAIAGDEWDPARYEPPPAGQPFPLIPGTPTPLAQAIALATASSPSARYSSAEAFAGDLRHFVAKESPGFSPLDLGRFVAEKFRDEYEQRTAILRRFEAAAEKAGRSASATLVKGRVAPPLFAVSPAPPDGGARAKPTGPSPATLRTSEPGTDRSVRSFARGARRRNTIVAATLVVAACVAGGVWLLQSRGAEKTYAVLPRPPPALPPVRPSLYPPPKPQVSVAAVAPATPADESDEYPDVEPAGTPGTRPQRAAVKQVPLPAPPPVKSGYKAAGRRRMASLAVETLPDGAAIRVDGKSTGQKTPATISGMPVGKKVTVDVALAGFESESRPVKIADSQNSLRLSLKPMDASIRVDGLPPGARIAVDGQVSSRNPAPARPGKRRIEASAEGFQTATREVQVRPGENAAVNMHLQPLPAGPGEVVVTCRPACSLMVDGQSKGRVDHSRPIEVTLGPGEHTLEARDPRTGRRKVRRVTVKPASSSPAPFDLTD